MVKLILRRYLLLFVVDFQWNLGLIHVGTRLVRVNYRAQNLHGAFRNLVSKLLTRAEIAKIVEGMLRL